MLDAPASMEMPKEKPRAPGKAPVSPPSHAAATLYTRTKSKI